jgi:hypothetical protein
MHHWAILAADDKENKTVERQGEKDRLEASRRK